MMNKKHLELVQTVLDDAVRNADVAGASCLVWQGGAEQGFFSAGFADCAAGRAFSRDTICRLYSMSKPITSAAVFSLVEKGKIDLLDDVATYLPVFKNPRVCTPEGVVKSPRPVTIRDLLNMTSGYSYGGTENESERGILQLVVDMNRSLEGSQEISTQTFAERAAQLPLGFVPGTDYAYGISADILGAVVEAVSGMQFSEYLQKVLFEPMGMTDTGFFVPEEKLPRFAEVYQHVSGGKLTVFKHPNLGIRYRADRSPAFESGGAGLTGTIDDYMTFCKMLLGKGVVPGAGSPRILQEETVRFMSTQHISPSLQAAFERKLPHLSGYSYGNLMRIMTDPSQSATIARAGEFGWDGWLGTFMLVDPSADLAVVYFMQCRDSGFTPTMRRVKNIVYASLG